MSRYVFMKKLCNFGQFIFHALICVKNICLRRDKTFLTHIQFLGASPSSFSSQKIEPMSWRITVLCYIEAVLSQRKISNTRSKKERGCQGCGCGVYSMGTTSLLSRIGHCTLCTYYLWLPKAVEVNYPLMFDISSLPRELAYACRRQQTEEKNNTRVGLRRRRRRRRNL